MVKGETGTLSLDVRTSVDKGVSTLVFMSVSVCLRRARFPLFPPLGFYCSFSYAIQLLFPYFTHVLFMLLVLLYFL